MLFLTYKMAFFSQKVWKFHQKCLLLQKLYKENRRMTKRLLIFSFMAALAMTAPQSIMASELMAPATEQAADDDITITISGQTVTVKGAQGQTLEVVSLTGRCVMSAKIDSPAQRIDLNVPKGCYILKVGKVVRKVTVR
jgi:hypothetical protein